MDRERLGQGRMLLMVGLAASLLSMPLILNGKAGAFGMMCLAVAVLGGIGGILKVAEATESGAASKWLAVCLSFLPPMNILSMAWFLLKANRALREDVQEDEAPAPQRPRRSVPPPSPPLVGGIAEALPAIKMAGLTGVADGQMLEARISAPGVNVPEADQPVCQALKGAFGTMYLVDQGETCAYATLGQMKAAGLTPQKLRQVALENLAAYLGKHRQSFKLLSLQDNAYGLRLDGQFEASLVLLDSLWDESLKKYLPNAPVVTIPSRDVCAFCDAASTDGIAALRAISARVSEKGEHLINSGLFIRKAGMWLPFEGGAAA